MREKIPSRPQRRKLPLENLFVAACVEHVLPPIGRKWPTLVQDLAQATALVKSTQSTDDQYGDRLEEIGQILAKISGNRFRQGKCC